MCSVSVYPWNCKIQLRSQSANQEHSNQSAHIHEQHKDFRIELLFFYKDLLDLTNIFILVYSPLHYWISDFPYGDVFPHFDTWLHIPCTSLSWKWVWGKLSILLLCKVLVNNFSSDILWGHITPVNTSFSWHFENNPLSLVFFVAAEAQLLV